MACDKCKIVELTNRVEVLEKREELRVAYDTVISNVRMNEWGMGGFSKLPHSFRSEQDLLDEANRVKLSTMDLRLW